jgi:Fe2+ or Zn2+ uptake regulation protein
MDDYQAFKSILIKNKHYVTRQRKLVFELIRKSPAPLSPGESAQKLKNKVDRSNVYRNLDLFVRLNILKKVTLAHEDKYELSDRFFQHHHHLTCESCGQVIKIRLGDRMESAISSFGRSHGFKITSHDFELRGLCKNCR